MARPPSLISLRLLSSHLLLPTSHSSSTLLSFTHPIAFNRSFSFLRNPFIPSELRYFGGLSPIERNKGTKLSGRAPNQLRQFNLSPEIVEATLSHCPSDTIALSFFLWCGRQPDYFHCSTSFLQMIPVVGRLTDKFESVRGVISELESVGCCIKAQTFLLLLRIYWHGGMYRLALEAFDEMVIAGYVPNTFARNIVIDVLFKIGCVDLALEVLRKTQLPNFLTFNTAICNLCKLNDWLRVRDVLKVMVGYGFFPNNGTFLVVMNCFCKSGRLMESLQLLGLMITLGYRPSVTIWGILIDGFCRAGRVTFASQLLRKMINSGCRPNVVIYTSLLKGYFEIRRSNHVFEIMNDMESEGCIPDLVLYNVLIDCLCKVGRYDDAIEVFLSLPRKNLKPDSYTFCSLLAIVHSSEKFALLPELVRGMGVSADLVVCNSLLNVFCKAGFPLQAVDFYNDMVDRGFTPDNYSYAGLLNGLCRAGRIDDAVNVYHGIIINSSDLDPHVHTIVFDGLIKAGETHRGIRLFRKAIAENHSLDVFSYSVAIYGLFKGDRLGEACSLFSQMKEAGFFPNIFTYNIMLCGLCKVRDVGMVSKLLKDMVEAGIELDCISFNTLVGLLYKLNRFSSAFKLFIEMFNLGLKPNKATHALLAKGLYHAGKVDEASLYLKDYLEDTIFVDNTVSDFPSMQLAEILKDSVDLEAKIEKCHGV
ncbi:putative pentatricopeptide repeat-containing protein [Cinnamomum micranthum f. kanehirae]|uniref:Putative pentatricopeptide repeat-containing protein n=1 Tax=Cinnamomum micranthum f. kanehirae TaxID=337451 RepID=A0A3S3P408_9MAGN|nr:putative pentatricopeptide repeat-containing protein [Cinnamomum micranthum f. kanehirae]